MIKVEKKYDESGKLIYWRNSDGTEFWYDEFGNCIRKLLPLGSEIKYIYDQSGNCIYKHYSSGTERWRIFDEADNIAYYRDTNGNESWSECDEFGNCIHIRHACGEEKWFRYDRGNPFLYRYKNKGETFWVDSDGCRQECLHHTDGKIYRHRNGNGTARWYEYDEAGNCIKILDRSAYGKEIQVPLKDYESWQEFDDAANCISVLDINVPEEELQVQSSANPFILGYVAE